jgi:hypothetical protein
MKLKTFIKEFGTMEGHTQGAKMMLNEEHYFLVAGADSEIAASVQWDLARLDSDNFESLSEARSIIARLVIGWSIDDPCTHKAVCEVFEEARYLVTQVNAFSNQRVNFTKS